MPRAVRRPLVALAGLAALAAGARADIDVEVGNADQVKGSIDPSAETELFRFVVPAGAKVTVRAKPGRRGPAVALSYAAPGDPLAAASPLGKGAAATIASAPASGEYRATVRSRDGTATGDYAFSAKWTPLRSWTSQFTTPGAGTSTATFGADAGARVTVTATAAAGSAALPRISGLRGPDGPVAGFADGAGGPTDRAGPLVVASTGDYEVDVTNDGAEGAVSVKVAVSPRRLKPRRLDVTARRTGTDGNEGAYARVVGEAGGTVEVPAGVDGLESIVGTSVDLPPGALPQGTAILIGTAPDLDLPGNSLAQIGPPVLFAPEGTTFGTRDDPKEATVSIPVNLAAVGGDSSAVRVFTRDAKGKVTEVPAARLDFVSRPGYVTFPTPHFSSYVAAGDAPAGDGRTLVSYLSGLTGGDDLCLSLANDGTTRLFFFTNGTDVLQELLVSQTTIGFTSQAYAGGGTSSSDGTPKGNFDFRGRITAVASGSDAVYVGTDAFTIYRIDVAAGTVARLVGDGLPGDGGDGGPSASAQIRDCSDLMIDQNDDLWFVDAVSARVRRIDSSGLVSTVAGTGTSGTNGDTGTVSQTQLDTPRAIAESLATSDIAVAERGRIRLLHLASDSVETLAGDPAGATGCSSGPVSGTSARFDGLSGVAYDFLGNQIFVSSDACDAIWTVNLSTRSVRVELGTPGQAGFTADGDVGPASRTSNPRGLVGVGPTVYFLEAGNGRVRQLTLPGGN